MANTLAASYQSGGPANRDLTKVTVMQKFGNHSMTLLDYGFIDKAQYVLPNELTPLRVRYGVSPLGVRTFYGYMNHYETKTDERGTPFTRVVSLGTSKPMNNVVPSTWTQTSRSAIARDLARRYRLRSVIHAHPYEVDHWATGPRSDFAALKALADEAGYRMWVDGSTLFFLDPLKLLSGASRADVPAFPRSAIRSLNVLAGSDIPGDVTASKRSVLYGVDSGTNEVFEAFSGDSKYPLSLVQASVTNYAEAQRLTDAASRKEGDYFVVKATLNGNARVYPGTLISLEEGRVNRDQGGYWMVTEAVHEVTGRDYTTKIVGVRGSDLKPLPRTRTTIREGSEFTAAVVRDGANWEAVLQEHLNV